MCTSIVANGKKTIVGWNLDLLDMECRVVAEPDKVYIAVNDATEGWMPLFGANARGDFVAMPTCWPHDARSNPASADDLNLILLDIDLLLGRKSFAETKEIAETQRICSVPGVTFQAQLSDRAGNVLQIVPGQGVRYLEHPDYAVMTNFSPDKGDREVHPWMGWDRYQTAVERLSRRSEDFDVSDCFAILRATAQQVCPTVVSMVFDVTENTVYWCEGQQWDEVRMHRLEEPERPAVAIRPMTDADYDAVFDLWIHTPGMGLNATDDSREGILRYLRRNPDTCFVAECMGDIVGVILSGHDGRRGYIYHTAVLPTYRGRGIGRALVEHAMEALEHEGIHKVALVAFRENEIGNAFWEKMGFTERTDLSYRNRNIHELQKVTR